MHDSITWFDLLVLVLFSLFIVRGVWLGFVRQLAAFFALVGSYVIAARFVGLALPLSAHFVDNPALVFFVAFGILFLLSVALFTLAGHALHKLMKLVLLDWFDRVAGAILGLLKAAILASLLYMMLAASLSATNNTLEKSLSAPYLRKGAELLKTIIQDPKLRASFKENVPVIPVGDLLKKSKAAQDKNTSRPASQGRNAQPEQQAPQRSETAPPQENGR